MLSVIGLPLIHPPLSSFPVALISSVVVLEMIGVFKRSKSLDMASSVLVVAAALGTAAAFFSGYFSFESASRSFHIPEAEIAFHHNLGRLLLFSVVPWVALHFLSRRAGAGWRIAYLMCLAVVFGLTVTTGFYGGRLVFHFGAGVSLSDH